MTLPVFVALLIGPAAAQEEACAGALPVAAWREAMDAVDDAIADFNGERANRILDDVIDELRCLDAPADPADLGRLARQRSLLAFFEQDGSEAETWGLLALETLGGAPWPADVPVPDAYRDYVRRLVVADRAAIDGRGLVVPKRGAVLLDGRLLTEPGASVGTMHLVQVADKRGAVTSTHWQHGVAFAEALLGAPGSVDPPKWYAAPAAPPPIGTSEPEAGPAPVADVAEEAAGTDVVAPVEDVVADGVADAVVEEGVDGDNAAPVLEMATPAPPEDERERMFQVREEAACPWKAAPKTVEASGREVRVNKHTFPVRTADEQAAFKAILRTCGELRAARRFDRWRDARRKLALDAGTYKDAMIKALLAEEKPRGPRPAAPKE